MSDEFWQKVAQIRKRDKRYHPQAYLFVVEALGFTQSKLSEPRHVTGRELLEGIKEYGKEQFGPTTKMVFEHWEIRNTEDFGNIVFNLVNEGLMGKTDQDSIEDFREVYDFTEEFEKNYRPTVDRERLRSKDI